MVPYTPTIGYILWYSSLNDENLAGVASKWCDTLWFTNLIIGAYLLNSLPLYLSTYPGIYIRALHNMASGEWWEWWKQMIIVHPAWNKRWGNYMWTPFAEIALEIIVTNVVYLISTSKVIPIHTVTWLIVCTFWMMSVSSMLCNCDIPHGLRIARRRCEVLPWDIRLIRAPSLEIWWTASYEIGRLKIPHCRLRKNVDIKSVIWARGSLPNIVAFNTNLNMFILWISCWDLWFQATHLILWVSNYMHSSIMVFLSRVYNWHGA